MTLSAPLVVVGSANADIFVEVDTLPKEGERIVAKSGQTFAGGKGASQASCAARLSYPTYFVGQVGKDGHASLVRDALLSAGVRLDHMNMVKGPTGHALVMIQPGGKRSTVVVQGANVSWPRLADGINRLTTTVQQLIRRAGAVLLQREVPDSVNMEAAKIARSANIPVILDAGGSGTPIPQELLKCVTVLSANELEVARLTGMPINTWEQVIKAAAKIQLMGVRNVLVKLGGKGAVLVPQDGPPLIQHAIQPPVMVDTTGASDAFTAAYAVALIERQSPSGALRFAAAAASLCIRAKGAILSMPERQAVLKILVNYTSIEQEVPPRAADDQVLRLLEEHTRFPLEIPATSSQVENKMQLMQIQPESLTV
jgi:ribokinase